MHEKFDVAIIGGAFSGASTALLLKRRAPHLRVLVLHGAERHGKLGELDDADVVITDLRALRWGAGGLYIVAGDDNVG